MDDLDNIDLNAMPMSDSDMDAIDNDDAYYDSVADQAADDPLDEDLDTVVEDDTETDDYGHIKRRMNPFKKVLMKMMDPEVRAKAKLIRAKAKHLMNYDKNQKFKLKIAAKKLGKLSLAALALKFMMDHHQDEVNKENENTLLKLYQASKQRKSKKKMQPASLFAISTLNPKEVHQTINKVAGELNNAVGVGQDVKQLAGTKGASSVLRNQFLSKLDGLAEAAGFNPTKIKNTFDALFGIK